MRYAAICMLSKILMRTSERFLKRGRRTKRRRVEVQANWRYHLGSRRHWEPERRYASEREGSQERQEVKVVPEQVRQGEGQLILGLV